MGKSTVFIVVRDVCQAIWTALQPEFGCMPSSQSKWLGVSKEYEDGWDFPHCLGAIDEKHVVIQAPKKCWLCFL